MAPRLSPAPPGTGCCTGARHTFLAPALMGIEWSVSLALEHVKGQRGCDGLCAWRRSSPIWWQSNTGLQRMWANGMQTTTLQAFDYSAGSFSAGPTAWAVRALLPCAGATPCKSPDTLTYMTSYGACADDLALCM